MAAEDTVEAYLDAIVKHDWDAVRGLVSEHVVRIGPYGETLRERGPYVDYLAKLMPHLDGYSMQRHRITSVHDGRRVFAELTEHVTLNGEATVTHEVLVLDLDDHGLIERVEIYMRRPGESGE